MRSLPSSSSSSYPLVALSNRLETLFRKAEQLSVLCQIEVCVIYYGPQGELKTWPHEREKVRNMAMRYSRLNESLRSKKRVNLSEFLKDKDKGLENPNKRRKTSSPKKNVDVLKYPISDHYSPDQIPQLIQSLQLNISTFQRRLRFLESQEKHKLLDHHHQSLASSSSLTTHSLNPSLHQSLASSSSLTTQSLNPSQQFSLFVYNHGDNTLSQIPVSASNLNNQDFSALLQGSQLKNEHNMY
ncbi:PREDICTED: agamous-like MADS-box protein AGL75 [Camelina sativa]|uniref:Agamous-like MADS-box protein AGL75 n=1 Tax=Camelina sativa TaxID=90675 RepID=A0ABM0U6U1_CAMSA|nr:PREDICTED: agamous-like MADS-box protein AGL75 [Camelina sativa]